MGETSTNPETGTQATPTGETKPVQFTGVNEPVETSQTASLDRTIPVRISGTKSVTVRLNVDVLRRQRSVEQINARIHRRSRG